MEGHTHRRHCAMVTIQPDFHNSITASMICDHTCLECLELTDSAADDQVIPVAALAPRLRIPWQ